MKKKAFTLTEILVVVVIVGIISAFAIPSFKKAMVKQQERDFVLKLRMVEGIARGYYAKNGKFPYIPLTVDQALINQELEANIPLYPVLDRFKVATGYPGDPAGSVSHYFISNFRGFDSSNVQYKVKITWEDGVGTIGPCCQTGPCPSLPNCI